MFLRVRCSPGVFAASLVSWCVCRIPKVFCLIPSVFLCVCCISRFFVLPLVCLYVFVIFLGFFDVSLVCPGVSIDL